jgi:hypothetical protein
MFRRIAARALWLTKGAALFGGAVVTLALVLGVGTMAAAAVPGDPFKLGQLNRVDRLSTLVSTLAGPVLRVDNDGSGTALDLRVGDPDTAPAKKGVAPMRVDSQGKVPNLNSDELDGKSADEIGVNGLTTIRADSGGSDPANSKYAYAQCPFENGIPLAVVGTGYRLEGAAYQNGDVVVTQLETIGPNGDPYERGVIVHAVESKPVAGDWDVKAEAICARVPRVP